MDGVYYDAKGNLLGIENEEERKNRLKPCPFCGGKGKIKTKIVTHAHIWIECEKCGASGTIFSCESWKIPKRMEATNPILEPVVKAWNKRMERSGDEN